MTVSFEEVKSAYNRIRPHIHKTPIVSSNQLNQWLGHEVYFKCENLQKVGAFKARGGCNTVSWLMEKSQKPSRIVANSSGNHAQSIAWASQLFGIPSTIFMPANGSKVKARATQHYGAELIFGKDRADIDLLVKDAAKIADNYWVPPFDHPQVIAGQGTVALEIHSEMDNIDAIFAPCGGGGLLSGTFISSRQLRPSTKIIGVEPLQANDAAQSRRAGKVIRLSEPPSTIADGVQMLSVCALTFPFIQQCDDFYEVSEDNIMYWTQWLTHLLNLHIEPTSAMAMDGVCQWLKHQSRPQKVVVILSGGNLDQSTMQKIWSNDLLDIAPNKKDD